MVVEPVPDAGPRDTACVVDLGDLSALVVDPEQDSRPDLSVTHALGPVSRYVAVTHLHADLMSEAREPVAIGASWITTRASDLVHADGPVADSDQMRLLCTAGTAGAS